MGDSKWHADGQLWPTIRPPLVPTEEDVAQVMEGCRPALERLGRPPRVLVLGVTPALVDAPWPEGSEIHSVDYDEVMIGTLWREREGRHCHCEHWQAMAFPDEFFDVVVGDCSFNALPCLDEYPAVLREIVRVSRPGAPLVCRFFMQPEPRLTLPDLPAHTAGLTSAAVRLLLLIASTSDDGGAHFAEVRQLVEATCGDFKGYLRSLGHDYADVERTENVLASGQELNYPSRAQIERAFEPFYAGIAFRHPSYDVGPYCPTVTFS